MIYINIRQLLNQHSIVVKWRKRLRITILSPPCPPPLDLSDRIPRTRCACNWLCACSCCAFTGGPDSSQAPKRTSHEEITAKRSTRLDLYMASASWFIMNYHASWLIWCLSIWPSIADFGPGRIHQSSLSWRMGWDIALRLMSWEWYIIIDTYPNCPSSSSICWQETIPRLALEISGGAEGGGGGTCTGGTCVDRGAVATTSVSAIIRSERMERISKEYIELRISEFGRIRIPIRVISLEIPSNWDRFNIHTWIRWVKTVRVFQFTQTWLNRLEIVNLLVISSFKYSMTRQDYV